MLKRLYLEYKITISNKSITKVEVFQNQKTFFEIECFTNSPYSIEEEIQNWLDENGYNDIEYEFLKID
jgi:hypothetical protein